MRTAGFHQANLITTNFNTLRTEVLAEVKNVQNNLLDAMTNVQPPADPPQNQTANVVVQDPQVANLMALITNLTTTVQTRQ